jgi:galactitol-specific phosphotransferase system IIC component
MLASLKLSLRRAGFGLGGAILMLIGAGFLTVAAWIALVEARDALFASLVIGSAYFGLGAIVMALGTRRPRYVAPPAQAAAMNMGGLSAAFVQGLGAGAAARTAMRSKG